MSGADGAGDDSDSAAEANDQPDWLPEGDPGIVPRPAQDDIITSGEYPMRVLAGAGTGKTFTMVRKIEYLIREENVAPDDILALTFTNKAADSMRAKLNAKLGPAGYDVDAYTYHSICRELLSEYAYHADIDPGFEIARDGDKLSLVLDLLDEIPYRFIDPDVNLSMDYGSGVVQSLQGFVGSMKRSAIMPGDLDSYLGDPHRLADLAAMPDRIEARADEHVRVSWRKVTDERLDEICAGLRALRADISTERDTLNPDRAGIERTVDAALAQMQTVCDALEDGLQNNRDDILDGDLESAYKLPAVVFGTYSGNPSGIPDDFDVVLTDVLDDFLDTCTKARDLTEGYAAYERAMAEHGLLDFDDLVVRATALLANADLQADIAGQWDYVFCDEFQDTDRLQFDLVEHLTTDDDLFVVGDDDQAIYEWRGANVENIRGELDDAFGPALADRDLEENFRSRQPILNLANNALDLVEDRASDKELDRHEEPAYEGDTVATITAPEDDEEAGAAQVVNTISHLLAGDADKLDEAYSPGDIAVLVRKNRHATPIIEAFDEAGIPYQLAGDLTADSVGVETVLAYLKALARPHEDAVSWNRVLTMRYRLHDADLRYLNTQDDDLVTVLRNAPLEAFREPERVAAAREDVEALLELKERVSVARLYRELTERTNIEWYLSKQEQRDLKQVEGFITDFGDGPVQPELDEQFIEAVEYHSSLTQASGASAIDQPEIADDAVNIMTIHKSKGLDFPVVFLPQLTADEWGPQERTYTALNHALTRTPTAPVETDLLQRDLHEARRLLHVGITRAEDILVLQGRSEDDDGDEADDLPMDYIEDVLSDDIPWSVDGASFPIWEDIQASLDVHADWTDTLAAERHERADSEITHDGTILDGTTARDRVLSLAREMLDGSLDRHEESPLTVATLDATPDVGHSLRHSYTSLETFSECERRHYLDYVTRAFDDYEPSAGGTTGPSQREIGLLFHETAEVAANRRLTTRDEWNALCDDLAEQHGWTAALDDARECIEDYFASPVSDWEIVSAEREFSLDIDGETIVGYIDAIYRTPDDELRVIDYKATERTRSLDDNRQLPLYLLACRDLLDEPVDTAGYLYVGPNGPDLKTRAFSAAELDDVRGAVVDQLAAIEAATFDEYTAGEHCEFCPHRSLPCSDGALE